MPFHEIGRIAAIDDGELWIELQMTGVVAQQPVRHRVERARPGEPLRDALTHAAERLVQRLLDDVARAAAHLERGPARECQKQYPRRIDPMHHEVRDAVCERVGLARARARDDEQRSRLEAFVGQRLAIGNGLTLRRVQLLEMGKM